MEPLWKKAASSLSRITIYSNPNNEPVTIYGESEGLRCIGVGTDAAVFQHCSAPAYAFKLYAGDKVFKVQEEEKIYGMLGDFPFFSTCFASGRDYLVLSYEEGTTLFDCLLQGIHIPGQVIADVEEARQFVYEKGLNPRDLHLKNILLQHGRAKILDVSEYGIPYVDVRWEHLKKAYETHYSLLDGRAVPFWLVETVRKWYNHSQLSSYDEFMRMVLKYITFRR
ncbi:serine/threonine protein kinase [Salibacterium aidingense]|uniref:serine/threonine protein kinase n=1 Tax=Salibacterium aidingense TaxID=384933 RepID=UPI003BC16EAB